MISSSRNPQVKFLAKLLGNAKFRREKGLFVAEGEKIAKEACRYCEVDSIYVSEGWCIKNVGSTGGSAGNTDEERIKKWLLEQDFLRKGQDIKLYVLSDSVFSQVSDTVTPQGIMATVHIPHYRLEDFLKKEKLFLIILENVSDPGNLGTIIRTAEGAGADGILLSPDCVDILNPKVVRSAMGALFRMPFFLCNDLGGDSCSGLSGDLRGMSGSSLNGDLSSDSCSGLSGISGGSAGSSLINGLNVLKNEGVFLYGAHLKGKAFYDEIKYRDRAGIVIGNESHGITEKTAKLLDGLVKIPMEGKVESLNASIAAGILMYEIYRQRRNQ